MLNYALLCCIIFINNKKKLAAVKKPLPECEFTECVQVRASADSLHHFGITRKANTMSSAKN